MLVIVDGEDVDTGLVIDRYIFLLFLVVLVLVMMWIPGLELL